MKMRHFVLSFALLSSALVAACGKAESTAPAAQPVVTAAVRSEAEENRVKAEFNTLEEARTIAKANAVFNAQRFRADTTAFDGFDIVSRGDSTIGRGCYQGDGWASMEFVSKDKATVVPVKCSTYSSGIGCLTSEDFKKKTFASEDGQCNAGIPFPIPKIAS